MSESFTPMIRFDKEENYAEFERVHGFDIRGSFDVVRSSVPDTRDNRDPVRIGETLLSRPKDTSVLEWADALERMR